MTDSYEILGLPISMLPREELLRRIEHLLEAGGSEKSRQIVTLNPIIFDSALKTRNLHSIIRNSSFVVPESVGIRIIGWFYGKRFNRFRGIDLMGSLLSLADRKKYSVYFLGSEQDIIEKAVSNIKKKYPSLELAGFRNGYFTKDDEGSIIESIAEAKPHMLFAGLSTPKQELWLGENLDKFGAGIVMGVGGSYDCLAGYLRTAPVWMKKTGLEWLFRTLQEPRRFSRIIKIPFFMLKMIFYRFLFFRKTGFG